MSDSRARSRPTAFALFTVIAGAIGWFASFELLTEYIRTLQNPDYIPNCSVSVLVTCGPNMGSWQGSLFGFSNPIIGVSAFVVPVLVGVALLAGVRFPRWFWIGYRLGLAAGFAFICWLSYQSVFVLGTLCPWCMIVWLVMIPLFWITMLLPPSKWEAGPARRGSLEKLHSWSWVFVVATYLVIAFAAQVRLDWLAEFARA
ncbi:vitamin K epoxide reductase family protein [Leucobacter sp. gxy201]|uniref:vitamin K epoxide reductase family protein n=1 Tax=Leucobacter sp. gxy201 TaxID=2957200 RepID=UPI003D9FC37A